MPMIGVLIRICQDVPLRVDAQEEDRSTLKVPLGGLGLATYWLLWAGIGDEAKMTSGVVPENGNIKSFGKTGGRRSLI